MNTDDLLTAKRAYALYRDSKRATVEEDLRVAIKAAVAKVASDHDLILESFRASCALAEFLPVGSIAASGGGAPPGTPGEFTSDMARAEGAASATYDVALADLKFKES